MELGLEGKTAIVCASSKGLGRGCEDSLAQKGAPVVINGTNKDTVAKTVDEIASQAGADVSTWWQAWTNPRAGLPCFSLAKATVIC